MPTPPKLATWLLSQFTTDEPLVGDLVERYDGRRSAVWFWKRVLWTIALSSVHKIRTTQLRPSFTSTTFNPKALFVSVVATGVIVYAVKHRPVW